jgi:hypothetical protein
VLSVTSLRSDVRRPTEVRVGEPRNRAAYGGGGGTGSDINTKGEEGSGNEA